MKKFSKRIMLALLCLQVLIQGVGASALVPGGQVIGLELSDGSVTIAAFDEHTGKNAKNAGLQVGDRIRKIDESPVTCAEDVRKALTQCDGTADIYIERNKQAKRIRVSQSITADGPRLGVYLKQGITGIGTVTWYDPETGKYGALGHGVSCQAGNLVEIIRGTAYHTSVVSVKKGKTGDPGQLMGSLDGSASIGTVTKNTAQGVFGTLKKGVAGDPIPLADPQQVRTGEATIRSTVQGSSPREYSVEILKIYPASRGGGRNLLLKVTDPALLATTGGIVQGMSGSPIIQDGKLVGAVTHVLVNDPTTGYGIFIENMLDAAA